MKPELAILIELCGFFRHFTGMDRLKKNRMPKYVTIMLTTAGIAIHRAYSTNPIPNQPETMMLIGLLIMKAPTRFAT